MPIETNLRPDEPWVFDAEVAAGFDEMLERSIPGYREMRRVVAEVARAALDGPARDGVRHVLDLGCSRGNALADVADVYDGPDRLRLVGIDVSPEMAAVARERLAPLRAVIVEDDVRRAAPRTLPASVDLALAVLTLQFVAIEDRQTLVDEVASRLAPGGTFVVVEKTLGETGAATRWLDRIYYERKARNGYTVEEIEAKREALSGVLVPQTASANVAMLRAAGLDVVEVWRSLQFVGWAARKPSA